MTEGVFLAIAIGGAVLLLSSILFGGIFELFEGFDAFGGLLSTTSIGLAATLFGANGYFLLYHGSPLITALGFGILWIGIGITLAVVIEKWIISKTTKVHHNIVGQRGTALTNIDTKFGKVQVNHYSETNARFAFSDSEITVGSEVVVLEEVDGKVKVATVTEKENNGN